MMGNLQIIKSFPGSLINNGKIEENRIFIEMKKDPLTKGYLESFNYNLHFNFGVYNSSSYPIDVSMYIDCENDCELKVPLKWIWYGINCPFHREMVRINGKMGAPGKFIFKYILQPGNNYFSNFIPIDSCSTKLEIEKMVLSAGGLKKIIGWSVDGRPIEAFEYHGGNNLPNLVFLSGFHPPESDIFAGKAIAELFLENGFKDNVLKEFNISFIPLVNPDGYQYMTQGSNLKGINMYWKFHGNHRELCPEAYHIWEYLKTLKPLFYMDFHAFTFQDNEPRPYTIPPWVHSDGRNAQLQDRINSILSQLCNKKYGTIQKFFVPAKIISPDLLSTSLMINYGTVISPKFHVHQKYGIEKSKELVKRCVRKSIDLISNRPINKKNLAIRGLIFNYRTIFFINRTLHFIRAPKEE